MASTPADTETKWRFLSTAGQQEPWAVDGALSFLGKILLEILEGDLDRLEGLIANLKEESRHFPPYRALSEKVAKAIIRRCPQKLVDQVGTVFGM